MKKLFFLLLYFHSALISMEITVQANCVSRQNLNLSLLQQTIPQDIHKEVMHFVIPNQWWYLQQTFNHDYGKVRLVCFDASGKRLTTGSYQETRIIDLEYNKEIASFEHYDSVVYSVCFDPTGKRLVTGSDKKARIIDIEQNKEIASFNHGSAVYSVCFDASGKRLATGSCDKKARIIDIEQNKEIASFNHDDWVKSVCFDPSGKCLATGSLDNKARIIDIEQNKEIASFIHNCMVNSVCFDPTGKRLGMGSYKKAWIIDLEQNKEIFSFKHDDWVNSVCFDPSGKRLGTGSDDKIARIFVRYDDYTLEQLQLKCALLTWLLIEKPNKTIDSYEKLLKDVAFKCDIPQGALFEIWKTFPQEMQDALWRTMDHRIQIYGKNKLKIKFERG